MEMSDSARAHDELGANMMAAGGFDDSAAWRGRFEMRCLDNEGKVLWEDVAENLLTTIGKNLALDTLLAGSSYSVTGPFIGLISSVGFSAVSAADTMASHAGWNEAQGVTNVPDYTGNRQTPSFSAASAGSKAQSAALNYVFTSSGTIQGAFMALNTGAVATKNSTAGSLLNAGTLAAAQPVISGNTLQVSFTVNLT